MPMRCGLVKPRECEVKVYTPEWLTKLAIDRASAMDCFLENNILRRSTFEMSVNRRQKETPGLGYSLLTESTAGSLWADMKQSKAPRSRQSIERYLLAAEGTFLSETEG